MKQFLHVRSKSDTAMAIARLSIWSENHPSYFLHLLTHIAFEQVVPFLPQWLRNDLLSLAPGWLNGTIVSSLSDWNEANAL